MTKHLVFILLIFHVSSILYGQEIEKSEFNKLVNKNAQFYYDKANKRYFGCGLNLECMGLTVSFRSIYFDKPQKKLKISGFVNPLSQSNGDTTGTNIFRIFIARPVNGELKNIRILADVENDIKSKSETTNIDVKELSFETEFRFLNGDRLYFEGGGSFRLKEYNISTLLKTNN
jgi:hypothetical protein